MHINTQQMTGSSVGRGRRRRGWVLGMLLGLLGGWQVCQAAEFTCTTSGDVKCLIEAITAANANGQANTIILATGTYTLTVVDNNTNGPNGLPSITSALTLEGAGAEATIIARDASAPQFRLVHVAASGDLTLARVTLRGGRCVFSVPCFGGGLFNSAGTVTLMQSTVTENAAFDGGGGLFNQAGTVTLTQSTVAGNNSFEGGGGLDSTGGTVTLTQSTVDGNESSLAVGGLEHDGGTLRITRSRITGNVARAGVGGLFASGTVTITQSTVAENVGSAVGGLSMRATVGQLVDSVVVDNVSGGAGGIENGGQLHITKSTVARNFGNLDGVVSNFAGTTVIRNTTIAENDGGGSSITVFGGSVTLQNTIFAGKPGKIFAPACRGGGVSLGNNLIGQPTACPLSLNPTDQTGNPGLDAFTDDGTPGNGHFPLVPASQAINKGNDAACPPTDQLGQPRVGQHCDIGAIEFQLSDTTPPAITIAATPDILWPPNGKLVPVTVSGTITDKDSNVNAITATYEVKDEYGLIQPKGSVPLKKDGTYSFAIRLQASRNGNDRDGRQYTITVRAVDDEGNEGSGPAIVTVPHDLGQGQSNAAR